MNPEITQALVNDRMQRRRQEADAERLAGCRRRIVPRHWLRNLFATIR
jgi:hypothetical protein